MPIARVFAAPIRVMSGGAAFAEMPSDSTAIGIVQAPAASGV